MRFDLLVFDVHQRDNLDPVRPLGRHHLANVSGTGIHRRPRRGQECRLSGPVHTAGCREKVGHLVASVRGFGDLHQGDTQGVIAVLDDLKSGGVFVAGQVFHLGGN